MGRPPGYQWQPLGLATDPVPGDPQAISAEAAHLASVATTITGQVVAMHKIASENIETGGELRQIRYVLGASTATSTAVTLANGGVTVYEPGGAARPMYDVPFWDRWEEDTTAGLPAWAVGGALSFNYVVSPMR